MPRSWWKIEFLKTNLFVDRNRLDGNKQKSEDNKYVPPTTITKMIHAL